MEFLLSKRKKLEKIFREHSSSILLYAYTLIKDYNLAEDIVQEVFAYLVEKNIVPDFPKSYLWRAVHNKVCNELRRKSLIPIENVEVSSYFSDPYEKEEERMKLSKAMDKLSEKEKQVVVMKTWGKLTFREISDLLDISQNTVASRYRYALESLKKDLQESIERAENE